MLAEFCIWIPSQATCFKPLKWACFAEGIDTPASADGLFLPDKRVDPGCWLRFRSESQRGQLVVSLFQDPISYGHFNGVTLYVPCLDLGLINYIHFPLYSFFLDSSTYTEILYTLLGSRFKNFFFFFFFFFFICSNVYYV